MGPLEHLPSIDSLGHSEKTLMVIILLLFLILVISCCICMRRERAIEESERRIDKELLKKAAYANLSKYMKKESKHMRRYFGVKS